MGRISDLKNKAIGSITMPLLGKAILVLVLVIGALLIRGMMLNAKIDTLTAEKETATAAAANATSIANDNHTANLRIAEELNKCSVENVRVKADGEKALAFEKEQIARIAKERDSWEKRYRSARSIKVCDELLSRSISQVCPNIKDF
jgi:hypothetical protein